MKDRLSALLDGDLDEHSMCPIFDRLRKDAALRREWGSYCLIGDFLRGQCDGHPGFVDRVMAGLDAEPTVLAPPTTAAYPARAMRRSLLPVAASVMGVAAVGLIASSLYSRSTVEATAPAAVAVQRLVAQPIAQARADTAPRQVSASTDLGLREYVFAHQGMGGGGPVPTAVQYVRTVSDVGRSGAR